MRVRLLAPHIIGDEWKSKGSEVDVPSEGITPLMEGLDEEAKEVIKVAQLQVWGRHPEVPYGFPTQSEPLDNPPIPRPLEENQPVERARVNKEYYS